MKTLRAFCWLGTLAASLGLGACGGGNQPQTAQTPADTRAADEAAIRQTDGEWVKAIEAKDMQQGMSAYAEDATLLAPGEAAATGKEEIQKTWSAMAGAPGFALTFAPARVVVARSGDLAYEIGDYSLTVNDKKGKPQTTKAKYVVVWGKQPDGKWKALVDAPTTTR